MHRVQVTAIALLCLLSTNDGLRILGVFPLFSKSHSILGHGIVNHLLDGGHEVVHITSFPSNKVLPNLTEVDVSAIGKQFIDENISKNMELKNQIAQGNMADSVFFLYIVHVMHKQLLHEPQVVNLLNDPKQQFDVIIAEWFFTEILTGLAPLFQCPLILFHSAELHWQVLRVIDEIPNPVYTVELFATSRPPLNFWQRAGELFKLIHRSVAVNVLSFFEKRLYNQVYPPVAAKRGVEMPPFEEAAYNTSLMFVNSHPSVGSPFKLPANVINIAGFHINDKVQPLPKELKKLLDEAKYGVIYFSMGSNLESKDMSEDMKQTFLSIFKKLKETVVWKFEGQLDNLPANVHLIKWAPQQSILAHPNLKLFITHGGQLSTTEAVHYGTPLVGLPVMADQTLNMVAVQSKGFGIKVTITEDRQMEQELYDAIQEILTNEKYKLRAKELSMIYHDRIATPGQELLHWVQHVVKTRGALHLRSPALHVPLYQKLYLDLAALIIVVFMLIKFIMKTIINTKNKIKGNKKEKSH